MSTINLNKKFNYSITYHNNVYTIHIGYNKEFKIYDIMTKIIKLVRYDMYCENAKYIFYNNDTIPLYKEFISKFYPSTNKTLSMYVNILKYDYKFKSLNILLSYLFPETICHIYKKLDNDYYKNIDMLNNNQYDQFENNVNTRINDFYDNRININVYSTLFRMISMYDKYNF